MRKLIRQFFRLDKDPLPTVLALVFHAIIFGMALFGLSFTIFFPDDLVGVRQTLRDVVTGATESDVAVRLVLIGMSMLALVIFLSLFFLDEARRRSGPFFYGDGIIRKGDQLHISMRVATLHNLLSNLLEVTGQAKFNDGLFRGGLVAGRAFGAVLPEIYSERIAPGLDWGVLPDRDRLDVWQNWDRSSGWGRMQISPPEERQKLIRISYNHPSLLAGTVGLGFCHFLAGYCEGVLNSILKRHRNIKLRTGDGLRVLEDRFLDLYFTLS